MGQLGQSPQNVCAIIILCAVSLSVACARPDRRRRQRAFEARQARIEGNRDRGWRRRNKPRMTTPKIRSFAALAKRVGAYPARIQAPCQNSLCTRRSLGRLFTKLDRIDEARQGVARILILGDSHIAADYISRAVRDRLQHRFGNAGRGFIAIDQKAQYGGRRISKAHWSRTRIVDGDGPGRAFGFAGMRLDSERAGARMAFELEPDDDDVVAYFLGSPRSGTLSFYVDSRRISQVVTTMEAIESGVHRVPIPEESNGAAGPQRRLEIVAQSPSTALFGLSFESSQSGVIVDAIGPVGADASVYLSMNRRSLKQHLRALKPDLIMLMIGGNDALAIRKGIRTPLEVEEDHRALVQRLRSALPSADCLLWAPLDAGVRVKGRIRSKPDLPEIRDMQRRVAKDMRCSFWDTYESMGGQGAFGRWFEEKLMNRDLIHPRAKGGDLLGHLFAAALIDAYLNGT